MRIRYDSTRHPDNYQDGGGLTHGPAPARLGPLGQRFGRREYHRFLRRQGRMHTMEGVADYARELEYPTEVYAMGAFEEHRTRVVLRASTMLPCASRWTGWTDPRFREPTKLRLGHRIFLKLRAMRTAYQWRKHYADGVDMSVTCAGGTA